MLKTVTQLTVWYIVASIICWPTLFNASTTLIGDPKIDVWNHAWGYWYVFEQLSQGNLPLDTTLVGAPEGGSLYFIDTPGAIVAWPITALFGPAVAYNFILISRVALAGLAAQLFCRELSGNGRHNWIAGLAYSTTPFLLCELSNGISEVCATQWIMFTFWATARTIRRGRIRDWFLVGVFQGLTTTATFYYGLASAIFIFPMLLGALFRRWRKGELGRAISGALVSVLSGIAVLLPHGLIFWESLHREDRLVLRDVSLNDKLLEHNAVDPLIYVTPGDYQSVNLLEKYGEPFIHTGYLRGTVILLAVYAFIKVRKIRGWFMIGILSLIMGMGSYLWWKGAWHTNADGQLFSLPFDWLRQLLPQIAITHPLRLSIGAQAIFCVCAAVGLAALIRRLSIRNWKWIAGAGLIIAAEGMFFSAATWPIPTASAKIPTIYAKERKKAVLDLPAEIGTSMMTSKYFWMQTAHKRPIPYTPDVRIGSAKDKTTFRAFIGTDGNSESPRTPSPKVAQHIRDTYGLIVLHADLDQELSDSYEDALKGLFGPAKTDGKLRYWELKDKEEKSQTFQDPSAPPKREAPKQSGPVIQQGSKQTASPEGKQMSGRCTTLGKELSALKQRKESELDEEMEKILSCKETLSKFCLTWAKRSDLSLREALTCTRAFQKYPAVGDTAVLIQLLRRSEIPVRRNVLSALGDRDIPQTYRQRLQRFQRDERIPDLKTKIQNLIENNK